MRSFSLPCSRWPSRPAMPRARLSRRAGANALSRISRAPERARAVSDLVLARLVADRAAHAVEHPFRMLREPLLRELLSADRAVGKAELGRLRGLGEELLTLRRVRREAEHDGQGHQHGSPTVASGMGPPSLHPEGSHA